MCLIFLQGPNEVMNDTISGGHGNGNGRLEPGEEALIYIKLPQGMGPKDVNTFHRSQCGKFYCLTLVVSKTG